MATTLSSSLSRLDSNFIGGDWRPAADGATDDVVNPATGGVIGSVPASAAADVDAAVAGRVGGVPGVGCAHAARAQRGAASGGRHRRRQHRRAVADRVRERRQAGRHRRVRDGSHQGQLALLRVGLPVPRGQGRGGVPGGLHVDGAPRPARCRRARSRPWNYPLNMATWKLGPALAAGNTVVLKPSELTPYSVLRLAELTADVLPAGVLNVVCGQGQRRRPGAQRAPGHRDDLDHRQRRRRARRSPVRRPTRSSVSTSNSAARRP